MNLDQLIQKNFDNIANLDQKDFSEELRESIRQIIDSLNDGKVRIADKIDDVWRINTIYKKAILLFFKMSTNIFGNINTDEQHSIKFFDKIPLKFSNWTKQDFINSKIRAVPGAIVRNGSYIGKNTIIMPSFVNIGAYVGDNTMIDSWATIGSCAQIGNNCHISGGVGIGGVLEPLQANPTIVEDNCFIGARSEIAEGVVIGEGSVLSMGSFVCQSTKIIDRRTKEITYGHIPPYSVVVPGTVADKDNNQLNCVYIVKKVDKTTRDKTSINQILRDDN